MSAWSITDICQLRRQISHKCVGDETHSASDMIPPFVFSFFPFPPQWRQPDGPGHALQLSLRHRNFHAGERDGLTAGGCEGGVGKNEGGSL